MIKVLSCGRGRKQDIQPKVTLKIHILVVIRCFLQWIQPFTENFLFFSPLQSVQKKTSRVERIKLDDFKLLKWVFYLNNDDSLKFIPAVRFPTSRPVVGFKFF